jgi:hypothetical protein
MAHPVIPRLSQSKSKGEFFERMGWDESDEGYKRLYQMMMVKLSLFDPETLIGCLFFMLL